jgi:hypothetical protein
MKIIEIKNEKELISVINEIGKFNSNRCLAETNFISIEKFDEETDKFTIIDKTSNVVYEVNKLYLFEHNDIYLTIDYTIINCEL